jgi:acetolactate synthase-like protein
MFRFVSGTVAAVTLTKLLYGFLSLEQVETERTGGHVIAEALHSLGIKQVFTLVGGHISSILVECKRLGIKVVDVRDEASTVFAADIVGRLTGVPGIALVTAGPGVTNTTTALQNAKMAQSPLILIGGAAPTLLKGRGALQDIDQKGAIRPYVKEVYSCTTVRSILAHLQKAFRTAMAHPRGPVFVECPIDLLYSIQEVRANMGLSRRVLAKNLAIKEATSCYIPDNKSLDSYLRSRTGSQPVFLRTKPRLPWWLALYMKFKLRWLFGNAFVQKPRLTLNPPRTEPAVKKTLSALTLMARSKKPIIVLGSQSVQSREQADSLIVSIEKLQVPVFLSGMARGLLSKNHPLHVMQGKSDALRNADCILLCGVEIDFRMDYGKKLSKKASIVAVHHVPDLTKQNSDVFWKPTLRIHSEPCVVLDIMAKQDLPNKHVDWLEQLQSRSAEKADKILNTIQPSPNRKDPGKQAIHPIELSKALEEVIERDAIVIGDGGDFVGTVANVLTGRGPMSWLDPGSFGTLGVGGGFALAAKAVHPEKPVWLLWGDGSSGYSIAEIDTMCRHNLPIIAVIGNDAGWTQIERDQVPIFNDDVACTLEYTAYHIVAEGYGGIGMVVKYGDNLVEKLEEAKALCLEKKKPVVVNCLLGSSSFREGSISV